MTRPPMQCCVDGQHTFSWRQGIEPCRFCGAAIQGEPKPCGPIVSVTHCCQYHAEHSGDDMEALLVAARDLNDWLTGPTPTESLSAHVEQGERLRLALAAELARWET